MPKQLSFDLPAKLALKRADFFVAPSNSMAVAMIDGWEIWPAHKLILTGDAGSGKTHLARVWASMAAAEVVEARDLVDLDIPTLARSHVAVENVPEIAKTALAEEALFHLHNLVLAEGKSLLLTGRGTPGSWALDLPDLQSRMQGTQHIALDPPDDALLSAVLAKLFDDRQLTPHADVIPYLVQHMDRSFAAAASVVEEMDQMALDEGRNLTRPLAIRLLGDTGSV